MNLQKARLLLILFGALGLVLLPLGAVLRSELILYAALLSYVLAVAVWFRFNRCPRCHKHLGRHTGIYCPYCKEKL